MEHELAAVWLIEPAKRSSCRLHKKYPQLALVPVYAQMRNLIDMLIVAFIQEKDYYTGKQDLGPGNEKVLSVEAIRSQRWGLRSTRYGKVTR